MIGDLVRRRDKGEVVEVGLGDSQIVSIHLCVLIYVTMNISFHTAVVVV